MRKLLHITIVLLCFSHNVYAWGKEGHHLVAQIAVHFLSNPAKQNLRQILGTTTPEEASTWMDDMRSDPKYDYMKTWHYINIPKEASYVPVNGENIVSHIQLAMEEIKHKESLPQEQVKTDVMILMHLIGDLHQPLHTGYGEDKGGNDMQVQFNGNGTNLHRLWDGELIEEQKITYQDCMSLFNILSVSERRQIQSIDVINWMNGSRALLPQVYDFPNHAVSEEYAMKNKLVIEHQLLYAGMRLAAVLEQLLSTGTLYSGQAAPVPAAPIQPPKNIIPVDAIKHMGEQVTVCGKVYGGKFYNQTNGKYTFINIDAPYPSNPLTIVIIGDNRANFSYSPETYLDGKQICVTGPVTKYKGKAQIIISKEEQIQLK